MFLEFFFDLLILTLLIADIGFIFSIYLNRKKEKDRIKKVEAKLFAKVVKETSFLFSTFLMFLFLFVAWQFPEVIRPLKTPVDLVLLVGDVSAEFRLLLSLVLVVVLFIPLVKYFRKVVKGQELDRTDLSKVKAENKKLNEVYNYILNSRDLPHSVHKRVLDIMNN